MGQVRTRLALEETGFETSVPLGIGAAARWRTPETYVARLQWLLFFMAGPRVRIHFRPAQSLQTFGSSTTAASFDNPDFVAVTLQSYRHRNGNTPGIRHWNAATGRQ
jgi:hypothetical protein